MMKNNWPIISIGFVIITLLFPNIANAGDKGWESGDVIFLQFACKDEKDIMEIAYKDSKDHQKAIEKLFAFVGLRKCIIFPEKLLALVIRIEANYTDSKGLENQILSVSNPTSWPELLGYTASLRQQGIGAMKHPKAVAH